MIAPRMLTRSLAALTFAAVVGMPLYAQHSERCGSVYTSATTPSACAILEMGGVTEWGDMVGWDAELGRLSFKVENTSVGQPDDSRIAQILVALSSSPIGVSENAEFRATSFAAAVTAGRPFIPRSYSGPFVDPLPTVYEPFYAVDWSFQVNAPSNYYSQFTLAPGIGGYYYVDLEMPAGSENLVVTEYAVQWEGLQYGHCDWSMWSIGAGLSDPCDSPGPITPGQIAPVPEPMTITLLGTGLLALGGVHLRRRRRTLGEE